jgi:prolyl 4-hydroxylase
MHDVALCLAISQYGNHFDYNYHERERPQGVRILTVFLYLNDVEEGGGETQFTGLTHSITVTPKRGKAVIFPNVLNHDPNSLDRRTKHKALPVTKAGVKYGSNVWFHQRDFQTPYSAGCTG